ncbi:hypothetical protein B0H13DRAFT_2289775 [Mycena leptocephala]|nr:hypothetical protein B0H13DRAFT_2289775 [Mycena leptocephala]
MLTSCWPVALSVTLAEATPSSPYAPAPCRLMSGMAIQVTLTLTKINGIRSVCAMGVRLSCEVDSGGTDYPTWIAFLTVWGFEVRKLQAVVSAIADLSYSITSLDFTFAYRYSVIPNLGSALAYDHWGRKLNLVPFFMTDKEVNGLVDFPSMEIRKEVEQVVSTVFPFAVPRMNCSVATAGSAAQLNYLADTAPVRSGDPSLAVTCDLNLRSKWYSINSVNRQQANAIVQVNPTPNCCRVQVVEEEGRGVVEVKALSCAIAFAAWWSKVSKSLVRSRWKKGRVIFRWNLIMRGERMRIERRLKYALPHVAVCVEETSAEKGEHDLRRVLEVNPKLRARIARGSPGCISGQKVDPPIEPGTVEQTIAPNNINDTRRGRHGKESERETVYRWSSTLAYKDYLAHFLIKDAHRQAPESSSPRPKAPAEYEVATHKTAVKLLKERLGKDGLAALLQPDVNGSEPIWNAVFAANSTATPDAWLMTEGDAQAVAALPDLNGTAPAYDHETLKTAVALAKEHIGEEKLMSLLQPDILAADAIWHEVIANSTPGSWVPADGAPSASSPTSPPSASPSSNNAANAEHYVKRTVEIGVGKLMSEILEGWGGVTTLFAIPVYSTPPDRVAHPFLRALPEFPYQGAGDKVLRDGTGAVFGVLHIAIRDVDGAYYGETGSGIEIFASVWYGDGANDKFLEAERQHMVIEIIHLALQAQKDILSGAFDHPALHAPEA